MSSKGNTGASQYKLDSGLTSDQGVYNLEIMSYPIGSKLHIGQTGLEKLGGVAWDCARVLAHYFLTNDFSWQLKRRGISIPWKHLKVLELGTGTGLAGIQLAVLGFDVIMTDFSYVLPLTKTNVAANSTLIRGSIHFEELIWSGKVTRSYLPTDIVLVADCLYEERCITPLSECLKAVLGPKTVAIFAYEDRNENIQVEFFKEISTFMDWEEVPLSKQHSSYAREFVHILFMQKSPIT